MIVDPGAVEEEPVRRRTYVDVSVTSLFSSVINYIYFIKSKIAVLLFPSSLTKLFPPLPPSPRTSESTLCEIKCTVPGLRAKFTNARRLFCCVSSPVLGPHRATVLYTQLLKGTIAHVVLARSSLAGMLVLTKRLLKCFILAGPSLVLDLGAKAGNVARGTQGNKSM